jgi:uncharacterized protein
MALKDEIKDRIKHYMREKKSAELTVVRQIKGEVMKFETSGSGVEAQDADVLKIINALVKQHHESISIFKEQSRDDLLAKEVLELEVLQSFLPEALSEEELVAIIDAAISETGAESKKDMGKVMGVAKAKAEETGKGVDGKALADGVKARLP